MLTALFLGSTVFLTWSLLKRRVWVLCFYFFSFGVLTIVNDEEVPIFGGVKLYRLAYAFLIVSSVVDWLGDPRLPQRFRSRANLSYLAIVVVLILSSFYSPYVKALDLLDPSGVMSVLVVVSLFWLAAGRMKDEDDFRAFALTSILLSACLSAWVILIAAQGDFKAFRGGTNVNENYQSIFILAGSIASFNVLVRAKKFLWGLLSLCALLLTLAASAILASRGTLIAAALGVTAMAAGLFRELPGRKVFMVLASFALVLVCLAFLPGASNVTTAFQGVDVSTLDDRTVIWGYAWQHFLASDGWRTFFGEGLSSAITVLGSFLPEYGSYHCDYLMWLMDRGIVGLSVYLFFLFRVGRLLLATCHPDRHLMRGWLLFLLAVGLTSTVSVSEHSYWVLLGVIVGAASQGLGKKTRMEAAGAVRGLPLLSAQTPG